MKKLAIFCPKIGERSETFIQRHIEELAPEKVVVVTFKILAEWERTWNISCPFMVIKDLSFESVRYSRRVQRIVPVGLVRRYYAQRIVGFLKQHKVDVILGQYLHQSWPFIEIAKQSNIRFFGHAHGYDLSKYWRRALWRQRYQDYRNTSGVIVVNRVMRDRMLSAGIPAELVHIVPYGVDVPTNMPERKESDHCRFLAVGRMVKKKAPLKTLEAFKLALSRNPNLILDYVGTGPLYNDVEGYINKHGLKNSVRLHGGQAHSFVINMMKKADCFLQHSIVDPQTFDEEGVPVAILEALAHGLPVISTLHTGIPEAVEHGQSGLLAGEGDVNGMSLAINKIAADSALRKSMSESAWKTAHDQFTWKTEKERLCRILDN